MNNRPKEYPFNHVKKLDDHIHWNPQKQLELRQKLENNIHKKNRSKKFTLFLIPFLGVVSSVCIVTILLAPILLDEDKPVLSTAANTENNIAVADLDVEGILNGNFNIHYVELDLNKGSECNFWLNNLHDSYNYKYKVYAPDGNLVGESTSAGTQERLYSVDLNQYGSGKYKIKVYTPAGNIGGKYHLRVRNF
ncbi:hypothetical protein [Cytobacillus sp. IB215665]|uniref:hypothetical protein n=1 Tax=Cytobacillus sp. IB215665 TaxID=3097357 RepID=UPI002A1424E9|nr:hypothetical protein [Cytobacillus sp. IB215665]MDX8365676.1 hypothetical protein [Cytobacillus sp. IB215665]